MYAAQCKAARAMLQWSAGDLAKKAKVPEAAIESIEADTPLEPATMAKVEAAFEAMGVEFTYGERPGVRFRTLDGIIEVSAGPAPRQH